MYDSIHLIHKTRPENTVLCLAIWILSVQRRKFMYKLNHLNFPITLLIAHF